MSKPPAHEIRLGLIKGNVWANSSKHGMNYTVNVVRLYKNATSGRNRLGSTVTTFCSLPKLWTRHIPGSTEHNSKTNLQSKLIRSSPVKTSTFESKSIPTELVYIMNHWTHLSSSTKDSVVELIDDDLSRSVNATNSISVSQPDRAGEFHSTQ